MHTLRCDAGLAARTIFGGLLLSLCLIPQAARQARASEFILTPEETVFVESIRGKPIVLGYGYELLHRTRPDGTKSGMMDPFLALLRDRLGLHIELRKVGWADAFVQLESGNLDYYGPISLTATRQAVYNCVEPIFRARGQIVTRVDDPLFSLMRLDHKKLGLLTNSTLYSGVRSYLSSNGEVVFFPTMTGMIEALGAGEIDCFATVDNAELEVLLRPGIRYEFTMQNLYGDQGFIGMNAELKPLTAIINRFLATPDGDALRAAVEKARIAEILAFARDQLADDIADVRSRYPVVKMFDSGILYPLSYWENSEYKGFQNDINQLFTDLTGIPVAATSAPKGLNEAIDLIKRGELHLTAGGYANPAVLLDPDLDYSPTVWMDTLRMYTYDETDKELRHLRIGANIHSEVYVNWDLVAGRKPRIYGSRRELLNALKKREVDAAFVSEMAFNYAYSIRNDFNLRELGHNAAAASLKMIYGARHTSLNRLFNASIHYYQFLYPEKMLEWRLLAENYKANYIRVREARHAFLLRLVGLFVAMALVILYLLRRYAKYDRQISQLIHKQQTFDLAWGDLKSGRIVSKGDFPFFRKWGLPFIKGPSTTIEALGRAIGRDLAREFAEEMKLLARSGLECVISEKTVAEPPLDKPKHYREYMHRLNDHQFMLCLQDTTDEVAKVESLTHAATTDFLSTLLTRRAMNDLLIRKCADLRLNGGRTFAAMLDIDNFKQINDGYGHDVGDEVLKAVSAVIQKAPGCENSTSRWGGEEFLAVFDSPALDSAMEKIQAIVDRIAELNVPVKGATNKIVRLTISAGLTELDPSEEYADSIARADAALYRAKREGKNCLRVWSLSESATKILSGRTSNRPDNPLTNSARVVK